MGEKENLENFLTKMTTLAQELRELKMEISSAYFATIILASLPDSYDNFLTSFNTRPIEELSWENIQPLLKEEYLKRKEKETLPNNYSQSHEFSDEALITNDRSLHGIPRFNRGGGRGGTSSRGGSFRGGFRGGNRSHPYDNDNVRGRSDSRGGSLSNRGFRGACFNCNQF